MSKLRSDMSDVLIDPDDTISPMNGCARLWDGRVMLSIGKYERQDNGDGRHAG